MSRRSTMSSGGGDLSNNSSNAIWRKWKEVFKKHKTGNLIDTNTNMFFNVNSTFKQIKPLVGEFFKIVQGLTKIEMGKTVSHILHVMPTTKRCWVHMKICNPEPKVSCYTMKEWVENKMKKTMIVQELNILMPQMNLVVDGEVN